MLKVYEEQPDGTLKPVQEIPDWLMKNVVAYLKLKDKGLGLEEVKFIWGAG